MAHALAIQLALVLSMQVIYCRATLLAVSRHTPQVSLNGGGLHCSSLENRGTHFTVDVEVGTPAQKFSVVADTGSNYLIVPSCICQAQGACSKDDRCFQGTNKSSSFKLNQGPKGKGAMSMVITFGSGQVEAVIASDAVRVAKESAVMKGGVLLMVNKALSISGPFEGILGLGLPTNETLRKLMVAESSAQGRGAAQSKMEEALKKIMGSGGHGHGAPIEIENAGGNRGQRGNSNASEEPTQKAMEDMIKKIMGGGGVGHGGQGENNMVAPLVQRGSHSQAVEEGMENGLQKMIGAVEQIEEVLGGVDQGDDGAVIIEDVMESPGETGGSPEGTPVAGPLMQLHSANPLDSDEPLNEGDSANSTLDSQPMPKSFLEYAGIGQFSMCFNDGAAGVLRLGSDNTTVTKKLGSVGQMHWGLGLSGISVGDSKVPALAKFCNPENMSEGQTTPCGAIPDSGTTVIMAPTSQLEVLLEGICDGWDRCSKNYTALRKAQDAAKDAVIKEYNVDPFGFKIPSKAKLLAFLLQDCKSWMDEKVGIDELPPLHFDVTGAGGASHTLKLPAWAYVLETMAEDVHYVYKHMKGLGDTPVGVNHTGGKHKVCSLAFGTMDYNTKQNGPVWILGTPLFYQFHVGYDLVSKPPSISFLSTEEHPCGSCRNTTSLLGRPSLATKGSARPLRRVSGPLRVPDIDTRLPM